MGSLELARDFASAAAEAFAGLEGNVTRVKVAGLLGSRSVRDAACEFHALCEGLAAVELRGQMTAGEQSRIWRDALTALVAGFACGGDQRAAVSAPRPASAAASPVSSRRPGS